MNKIQTVLVPKNNVMDDCVQVVAVYVQNGQKVEAGQVIVELENSKSVYSIEVSEGGFIHLLVNEGDKVSVGREIAFLFDQYQETEIDKFIAVQDRTCDLKETENILFSKQAVALMKEKGLTAQDFTGFSVVSEDDVKKVLWKKISSDPIALKEKLEKIKVIPQSLILYGAGFQASVVFDLVKTLGGYVVAAFVDTFPPKQAFGEDIPVLGQSQLSELKKKGISKAHVCIGNAKAKKEIALLLKSEGFELVNLIHPSAEVSDSAVFGENVFIGPKVLIGPYVQIGNYCQINNASTIAHHSRLGEAVLIADGTHLAGNVTIEDEVFLGIGVTINKRLTVGKGSELISGVNLYDSVEPNCIVKLKGNPYIIHSKNPMINDRQRVL